MNNRKNYEDLVDQIVFYAAVVAAIVAWLGLDAVTP